MSAVAIVLVIFILLIVVGIIIAAIFLTRKKEPGTGTGTTNNDPFQTLTAAAGSTGTGTPVSKFFITNGNTQASSTGYLSGDSTNTKLVWLNTPLPVTDTKAIWNYGTFKGVDGCLFNDAGACISVTGVTNQLRLIATVGLTQTPVKDGTREVPVGTSATGTQDWVYVPGNARTNNISLWEMVNCDLGPTLYMDVTIGSTGTGIVTIVESVTKLKTSLFNLDSKTFSPVTINAKQKTCS